MRISQNMDTNVPCAGCQAAAHEKSEGLAFRRKFPLVRNSTKKTILVLVGYKDNKVSLAISMAQSLHQFKIKFCWWRDVHDKTFLFEGWNTNELVASRVLFEPQGTTAFKCLSGSLCTERGRYYGVSQCPSSHERYRNRCSTASLLERR